MAHEPSNEELVLAAIKTNPLSRSEIEQSTGLTFAQVRYALAKLMAKGKARRIGNGSSAKTKYTLP
jgi:predicted HTH transcriptional regulator